MKKSLVLLMAFLLLASFQLLAGGKKEEKKEAEQTGVETERMEKQAEAEATRFLFQPEEGVYPFRWASAADSAYKGESRWIYATPTDFEKVNGKKLPAFKEAPMLQKQVSEGKLPPVAKRLPEEPLVVKPFDEVGSYGGIVHTWCPDTNWQGMALHLNNSEAPLRPVVGLYLDSLRPRPNVPNVVKDWELTKDKKQITLYLRRGMKWSDGEPFTADDIVFWYEDVLLNNEITPAVDSRWIIGGEVWKLKKLDETTIQINFAAPFPWILYNLATWGPEEIVAYPKHYLKQFHPRYTAKAELDKKVKDAGFEHWYELFNQEALHCWSGTSFVPTLSPYYLKEVTTTGMILERNPYYWKVDTEGNQLPYFDSISCRVVPDTEVQQTMAATGQFDFAWSNSTANFPLFRENAEKEHYKVLIYPSANRAGGLCVSINQTYRGDLVLRDIFRDKRFRQAMSVAINRNEMNEVLYYGQARPCPSTVLPASIFYLPEYDKAYTQYDTDLANRLLDEMGLKWDAKKEFRLRPDGKRLTIVMDFVPQIFEGADGTATAEILVRYWKAVGVECVLKSESDALIDARVTGNEAQFSLWGGATTTDDNLIPAPHHYVLWHQWADAGYGPLWVQWALTDGKEGEKPPADLIRMTDNWKKLLVSADEQEILRLGREIFRWNAENILTIGMVGMIPAPEIVRDNMRNIPPTGMDGGTAGTALIDYYYPEQFYFKPPLYPNQTSY
jgi:peptide/nickel transport system substrate-binding protein